MEALSRIISYIMVVMLLTLLPLEYLLGHQIVLNNQNVEIEASRFVEDISKKGYLDIESYEDFIKKINITGGICEVELEHAVPKEGGVQFSTSELPGVTVASNGELNLTIEENRENVEDGSFNIQEKGEIHSLATHTHTTDCYNGESHICDRVNCAYTYEVAPEILLYGKYIGEPSFYYTNNEGLTWSKHNTYISPQNITYTTNGYYFSVVKYDAVGGYNYDEINKYLPATKELTVIGTTGPYSRLMYRNGYYYSNSSSSPYINYNTTGSQYFNWSYIGGNLRVIDILYGNNIYVAAAIETYALDYGGLQRTVIFTSSDGKTWTRGPVFEDISSGFVFAGDRFILGRKDGFIISSTDGVTWNNENPPGGWPSGYAVSNIVYGNNILAIGYGSQYYITSDNGQTYRRIIADQNLYYFDGYFYVFEQKSASSSGLKRSSDLISWTQIQIPKAPIGTLFSKISFNSLGDTGYIDRGPCTKVGKYYNAEGAEVQPICHKVVTSITATNPVQTVDKGGSIITTATATYLDGHTEVVSCSSNYNPNITGTQNVTLTYTGLVGNAKTTGTRTCSISVTVRDNNIPESIIVVPSAYTVYNGSEPTYAVTVRYTNGTTKPITSGYSKTGWSSGYGTKHLSFSYTENGKTVSANISITVKPNLSHITVTPISQYIERYTEPVLLVHAVYEDGSEGDAVASSISGLDKNVIGEQNVTVSYTENLVTRSVSVRVIVTPMKRICTHCGSTYLLDGKDFDAGCPNCRDTVSYISISPVSLTISRSQELNISVTAYYLDGHTETVFGWTSNLDSSKLGMQLVRVTFQEKFAYVSVLVVDDKICTVCNNSYSLSEDGSDPGCPTCREALEYIVATPTYQSINQGDDISLLVRGVYRDGHVEELQGWYTNYDKNKPGRNLVTVFYKQLTCMVTVEVLSELEISCSVCGATYNLRRHPWGCPVCAETITNIEAALITGGTLTPLGESLKLRVILTYRSGQSAFAYEGWTDNFNPSVIGAQTVTISYTDRYDNTVSCELNVEVSDKLKRCVCERGHVYYSDSDAECPSCSSTNPGEVAGYFNISYTTEILDKLYRDGIYRFKPGDYITVSVKVNLKGSVYSFGLFKRNNGVRPVVFGGKVE